MAQRQLPVTMVGAGLPQVRGRMGNAKSYAERLFDFPEIGPLSPKDAKLAIAKPAADEGVTIEEPALDAIVARTGCYPYFLQEWGKHLWDTAESSPITIASVETASAQAIADLDASFFMVRFDRLTQSEKIYLRAMASLGEWDPPLRRHRPSDGPQRQFPRTHSQSAHQQGHGLESEPWRYRLHRPHVRRVHAAHHAGGTALRWR